MTVRFTAKSASSAEIWLYDQVGKDMWGEGIGAKDFRAQLNGLGKVSTINLRINSPGGDVFDGFAIYNALAQHPARIVVDVDGLAASIASVIAMAGDEIRMASNSMMMIHDPQGVAVGNASEMMRTAALLDQIKGQLVDTYKRTGMTATRLAALMQDETWMTASEAMAAGFCDSCTTEQAVNAHFARLTTYQNVPAALRAVTARDIASVRISRQAERLQQILGNSAGLNPRSREPSTTGATA